MITIGCFWLVCKYNKQVPPEEYFMFTALVDILVIDMVTKMFIH